MKNAQAKTGEVILIDGHKVILRYADRHQPKVMENIQEILFNQKIPQRRSLEICNTGDNMR